MFLRTDSECFTEYQNPYSAYSEQVKAGKFTLQLKLREMFLSNGYNIGQLGTEPNSLLFGFDTVFPMGYNSSVKIKDEDCVNYLNNEINRMCEAEKDIIIVGSQSGTVTYDTGNLSQYNISQYNFLIGTQPDVVILCVNPYDEPDLIKRTIKFIESSVNKCKVIALVVFLWISAVIGEVLRRKNFLMKNIFR